MEIIHFGAVIKYLGAVMTFTTFTVKPNNIKTQLLEMTRFH